ncbi:MAG: hypothetical protein KGL39_46655 [Patescibacteria group bacterium]|nr:hypothetical protein [Patescibacteria group bacterium]
MPILIVIVGLILIVSAIRGTTGDLATNLSADITGGFVKWLAAIIAIGALGYVPALKEPSRYLIALVAVVVFLTTGKGFLSQFVQQIENPPQPKAAQPVGGSNQLPAFPVGGGGSGSGSGSGGGGSSLFGNLEGGALQLGGSALLGGLGF